MKNAQKLVSAKFFLKIFYLKNLNFVEVARVSFTLMKSFFENPFSEKLHHMQWHFQNPVTQFPWRFIAKILINLSPLTNFAKKLHGRYLSEF